MWVMLLGYFELATHVLNVYVSTLHFLFLNIFSFIPLLRDLVLHSDKLLPLIILVDSPLGENLHGLDVLDGSHLIPVVLVAT